MSVGVLTKRVLDNILRNKRVVSLVSLFFRGDRGPYMEQKTIEGTEGCSVEETEGGREDRGPQRGQIVIEGKRAVEETESSREDRGP
jgi:hypothetical protein